ncbi:MAG: hypothetical protein KF881_12125 [Acidobacteria bacterium]|nr:hypothetical protein [Acidobacteriota bacterium]
MPDKPFPRSEGGVEQLLDRLADELPGALGPLLGLSSDDLTRLTESRDNYHYVRDIGQEIIAKSQTYSDFKDAMFYGPESPKIEAPTFPVVSLPHEQDQGIIPFMKYLIRKLKASENYNEGIGETLDLITDNPTQPDPENMFPELTLRPLNNSVVEVKFSRSGQDALRLDWRAKGDNTWLLAGIYTSSPGLHTEPSPNGDPQAREYRGILLKKNQPVSQYSPTYNVITTP